MKLNALRCQQESPRLGVRGYTVLFVASALFGEVSVGRVRRTLGAVGASLPQVLGAPVHHARHLLLLWRDGVEES